MEVKLDKQFPLEVGPDQAWAVLRDIRAVAPCMPGAQITEQTDDTHYKGTVKAKIGPASMQFNGTIEVLALDAATRTLQMLGKGADRTGSAASMNLSARIVDGPAPGTSVLEGQAVVTVSGKLAQFGSRLLVPVSDALLAEFANYFRHAAAAVPAVAGQGSAQPGGETPAQATETTDAASLAVPSAAATPATSLNALSLAWVVIKQWLRGLFGRKP
jgi:carbon monoxide dehydrogenase subunit G